MRNQHNAFKPRSFCRSPQARPERMCKYALAMDVLGQGYSGRQSCVQCGEPSTLDPSDLILNLILLARIGDARERVRNSGCGSFTREERVR